MPDPKSGRAGKLSKGQSLLNLPFGQGAVVKEKAVTVGREHERYLHGLGIAQGLLHAGTHGMVVVFGFNDGEGNARLEIKDVVGATRLAPGGHLAPNDHAALREGDLLPDLGLDIPPGREQSGRNEFGANVPLAEQPLLGLIHGGEAKPTTAPGSLSEQSASREARVTWRRASLRL